MSRRKQTKGKCAYCEKEIAKSGVGKHLATCAKWKDAEINVGHKNSAQEMLYHLRVQALGSSEFWLDLEMRGSDSLKELDKYLRAIWLECCGHMSQFLDHGNELSMIRRIGDVLELGSELKHIYDFGTTSETLVKVVGMREGKPVTSRPIVLLVRNVMPVSECMECEQPATRLCMECLIEEGGWGTLCDKHAENHPHDEYGEPVPLVNSPRLGMCGYYGPAKPPY
jgi:hypothetical protein